MIHGKQLTVVFHKDDCMSSHIEAKVNDKFKEWLNFKYGSFGVVSMVRGKSHNYLGMKFHFVGNGELKVEMFEYIKKILKQFPMKFGNKVGGENTGINLFK